MHHHHVKGIAEQGRGDADVGHQTVVGLSLREESEGKQSQQRTIGGTGQYIDGVNQLGGVQLSEQQDKQHEEATHDDMHLLPKCLIIRLPTDIHTETGR